MPKTTILGIIPQEVTFDIELSQTLKDNFQRYIKIALNYIENEGFKYEKRDTHTPLRDIIAMANDPSFK